MNPLLKWAIENSQSSPKNVEHIDKKWIDALFPTGNAVKDLLDELFDASEDETRQVDLLEELEDLLSQEHANSESGLKALAYLFDLLTNEKTSDLIKKNVLWVIGSAVQNNQSVAEEVIGWDGVRILFDTLEACKEKEEGVDMVKKATYAISSLLTNQPTIEHVTAADLKLILSFHVVKEKSVVSRILSNTLLLVSEGERFRECLMDEELLWIFALLKNEENSEWKNMCIDILIQLLVGSKRRARSRRMAKLGIDSVLEDPSLGESVPPANLNSLRQKIQSNKK